MNNSGKAHWIHKWLKFVFFSHIANCTVNRLSSLLGKKCEFCWQVEVSQQKNACWQFDPVAKWLISFSLFVSILDAEEYQPPIWKSYCEYTSNLNNLSALPRCQSLLGLFLFVCLEGRHKCTRCLYKLLYGTAAKPELLWTSMEQGQQDYVCQIPPVALQVCSSWVSWFLCWDF